MKSRIQKLLSLFLILAMCIGMAPVTFAVSSPSDLFTCKTNDLTMEAAPYKSNPNEILLSFTGTINPSSDIDGKTSYPITIEWTVPQGQPSINLYYGIYTSNHKLYKTIDAVQGKAEYSIDLLNEPEDVWYSFQSSDNPVLFKFDFSGVNLADKNGINNAVSVNVNTTSTEFPTFNQAMSYIKDNFTSSQSVSVDLLRDIDLSGCDTPISGSISFPNANITLDLMGHSIYTDDSIFNNGRVTIENNINSNPNAGIIVSANKPFIKNDELNHSEVILKGGVYRESYYSLQDENILIDSYYEEQMVRVPVKDINNNIIYEDRYIIFRREISENPSENGLFLESFANGNLSTNTLIGPFINKYTCADNIKVSDDNQISLNLQDPDICGETNLSISNDKVPTISYMAGFGAGLKINFTSNPSNTYNKQLEISREAIENISKIDSYPDFSIKKTNVDKALFSYKLKLPFNNNGDISENNIKLMLPVSSDSSEFHIYEVDRNSPEQTRLKKELQTVAPITIDGKKYIVINQWDNWSGLNYGVEFAVYSECVHANMKEYAAKEATCISSGQASAWYCPDCKKWFNDADGISVLDTVKSETDLVTRKAVHKDTDENGLCDVCGKPMPYYQKVTKQSEIDAESSYLIVTSNPIDGSYYSPVYFRGTSVNQAFQFMNMTPIQVTGDKILYNDYVDARNSGTPDFRLISNSATQDEYAIKAVFDERWFSLNIGTVDPDFCLSLNSENNFFNIIANASETKITTAGNNRFMLKCATGHIDFPGYPLIFAEPEILPPDWVFPDNNLEDVVRNPIQLYKLIEPKEPAEPGYKLNVIEGTASMLHPIPGAKNEYIVKAGRSISLVSDDYTNLTGWIADTEDVSILRDATGGWKLIMPNHDVTVRPTYSDKYFVEVINGWLPRHSSSDSNVSFAYQHVNDTVLLKANAPLDGQEFTGWTFEPENISINAGNDPLSATFDMPSHDVKVTATYKTPMPHSIIVEGGKSFNEVRDGVWEETSEAYCYELIKIVADEPQKGYKFSHWESNIELESDYMEETYFVMPEAEVSIKAVFVKDIKLIGKADLYVDDPIAGIKPNNDVNIYYEVYSEYPIDVPHDIEAAVWSPEVSEKFAEDTEYTLTVEITAPEGFAFGANTLFNVNDIDAIVISSKKDGVVSNGSRIEDFSESVTVSFTFPVTGATQYSIDTNLCSAIFTSPEGATSQVKSALPGTEIRLEIYNPPESGTTFDRYETTGITLDNPKNANSKFIMPERDVSIFAMYVVGEHQHSPEPNWTYNTYAHWKNCDTCGMQLEYADHTFGEWIPASDGSYQERSCSVCGYKETSPRISVNQEYTFVQIPPETENLTIKTNSTASVTYDKISTGDLINKIQEYNGNGLALSIVEISPEFDTNPEGVNKNQEQYLNNLDSHATLYSINLYAANENEVMLNHKIVDFSGGFATMKVPIPDWCKEFEDLLVVQRLEEDGSVTEIKETWTECYDGTCYFCWRSDSHSLYLLTRPDYYGYSKLNSKEKMAYSAIHSGVSMGRNVIDISASEILVSEIEKVFEIYLSDHPESYALSNSYGISYYGNQVKELRLSYLPGLSDKTFNSKAAKFLEAANGKKTQYAKALALHDAIVKNVRYAETSPISHTAYGAIVNGTAVCEGYAKAYQYLLRQVGIESYVVNGKANGGDHAWNLLRLDGKYYYTDVTWDDPTTSSYIEELKKPIYYSFMNLSEQSILKDHVFGDVFESIKPIATDDSKMYHHFIKTDSPNTNVISKGIYKLNPEGSKLIVRVYDTSSSGKVIQNSAGDLVKSIGKAAGINGFSAEISSCGREVIFNYIPSTAMPSFPMISDDRTVVDFAEIGTISDVDVIVHFKASCQKGDIITAAGYDENGKMIALGYTKLKSDIGQDYSMSINGEGFDGASKIKLFITDENYTPRYLSVG